MPPRFVVALIAVFWLVMTGVLIREEIAPRWRSGEAPAFAIELTDEIGSPQVSWLVYQSDKKIGTGLSQVRRRDDRTFEMAQKFRFDDFTLPLFIKLKKLDTTYRLTRDGRLLGLNLSGVALFQSLEIKVDLEGEIVDGFFEPKITLFGDKDVLPPVGKFKVAEHGSILNPMYLLHRLPNLREGQQWRVPLFDPIKMFSVKEIFGQHLPSLSPAVPYLDAEVFADSMTWKDEEVECLRVSYREPGKDEIARTWVRRFDGLVLAQEAKQTGFEISIRRER